MANRLSSAKDRPASPSRFDVCVIGHVTRDIIRVERSTITAPGGSAYYTSIALKRLGLRVAVLTRVAKEDENRLLDNVRDEGIAVYWKKGHSSSAFENIYSVKNLDTRLQRVTSIGTPFSSDDLGTIEATLFHLGPLTSQDIPIDFLKQLAARPRIVSLDVQGMLRPARLGEVVEEDWANKKEGLSYVDILKADEKEALVLSGEKAVDSAATALASLGPKEIIVTMGSQGSLIYAERTLHAVPCCLPRKTGYRTGCGDTYMAGYLYQRLKGVPPESAGRFAAATATLKMEYSGPFRGSEEDVADVLSSR